MLFKLINSVMVLMFVFAIFVQFNDPDPLLWIALYGAVLSACIAQYINMNLGKGLYLLALVYAAGIAYLSPSFTDTSMHAFGSVGMDSMQDELVRELWGLIICLIWTGVLILKQHFSQLFNQVEIDKLEFTNADKSL